MPAQKNVSPIMGLCAITLGACVWLNIAGAQENGGSKGVVPEAERRLAADRGINGPTQNQGIKSIAVLGTVDLGSEFAAMNGRQLRARELVIEAGGVVAVHQHDARPGMAYILEGEIVEHRNDQSSPIVHKQGSVAFEKTGVAHWWENKSLVPVRALVVDVVPIEQKR